MITAILIFAFFCLIIFTYVGLYLSSDLTDSIELGIFWLVYILVAGTILNIFVLSYFWATIRKKTGPIGIRGPIGDVGDRGDVGKCGVNYANAMCVASVNQKLNKLYQQKTGINETILDNDNNLINGYMRRKLHSVCNSAQFDTLNDILIKEGKGAGYLIHYIAQIFSDWFELIYEQNDNWFKDADGNQNSRWKTIDPFIEIRKYDIYNWGETRKFKRLKNKICSINGEAYIAEPKIRILKTNDYDEVYDDAGSGASIPLKIYRPKTYEYKGIEYFPLGDVNDVNVDRNKIGLKNNNITRIGDLEVESVNINNGPDKQTILVSGDVVDPIDYKLMWRDQKYTNSFVDEVRRGVNAIGSGYLEASSGYGSGRFWKPVAPEGYICLGDVVTNYFKPNHENRTEYNSHNKNVNIKCIPIDCVEEVDIDEFENPKYLDWKAERGQNSIVFNGEIYSLGDNNDALHENSYNLFRTDNFSYVNSNLTRSASNTSGQTATTNGQTATTNGQTTNDDSVILRRGDKFYRIKESCLLSKSGKKNKKVQPEFEEIGIGWYGNPINRPSEAKYSIFKFMNLVPEGRIESISSLLKLYIVHYGGNILNCYNIYTLNEVTGEYDLALDMGDLERVGYYTIRKRELNRGKKSQQWKLEKTEDYIYFRSMTNNMLLASENDEIVGKYEFNETCQFNFIPAFGISP